MTTTKPKGRYAHVVPGRQECHLRGIRLGTIEVPGRTPPTERADQHVARLTNVELRAKIMEALHGGVNTMSRIKGVTGYPDRADNVMAAMIDEGVVARTFKGKKAFYEVAK